jgi:type IV conjugative transfer system coupling protein TraD
MESESSIKNFTRGGQIFLHNMRMVNQIMNRLTIFCIVFFVILIIAFTYLMTTEYQLYLAFQYVVAKCYVLIKESAKQVFINPNGQTVNVYSHQIIQSEFVQRALQTVFQAIIKAIIISFFMAIGIFALIYQRLKKGGKDQAEVKKLRGDEIADWNVVEKQVRKTEQISDIKIANLSMPKNFECRHTLIHGTTGSGKSVCIRELLDQIRKRGDRAIIYDKGCGYISAYYREKTDIILNPLDERTASWHLWNECRDSTDFDSLAAALMPLPTGAVDPFWINAARTIFAAAARQMKKQDDCSMINLLKSLLTADLATMENFLRGTEAETLVSEKIEKTAVSIKSVLATYLKSLKYVKDEENPFSIRRWVQDDTQSNWLFISSLSDRHETLKPLISMWLDLAANALMSLTPSDTRRIWIILDELPTLQRLPYLPECFAESRKFGGCLVAGLQSIAQLRKIYGTNAAEEISGLCNSRIFFREPSSETAQWVSRELGQAEIEEIKEGISYSESAMRSGISISKQQSNRQIVNASEIMRLNDLEAYIRLPGKFPITKIQLEYKKYPQISDPFILRKIDERNFNEINSLIEKIEVNPVPVSATTAPNTGIVSLSSFSSEATKNEKKSRQPRKKKEINEMGHLG